MSRPTSRQPPSYGLTHTQPLYGIEANHATAGNEKED